MAGGYRCSHGHTWSAPDGSTVTACPVCGDTVLLPVRAGGTAPVFVMATAGTAANAVGSGQEVTGEIAVPPQSDDSAHTREFVPETPPPGAASNPSFASLTGVVLVGSSDQPNPSSPNRSGEAVPLSGSDVVPFGAADSGETVEFRPPLVPGYEIVGEVGRGGMGVVYKARQLNLNRTVALKMILTGSHAGPTERDRFRREAESVAALQHPHIVQIFDIGDANGCPYLALEFVEGGSLAQHLTTGPWPAMQAAELLEVLARAVQFAHDAGIVHRDLKPGNILIADGGWRMAESKTEDRGSSSPQSAILPKVTDFGLAKRLDETFGDGATRTGAVMGTPSYIAPEQASGKQRDIGPPTDVYALGAVLYELLTGRPPFKGETPLDTVLQVLHDDPVPPKRLQPDVPRDLETICLKSLSKQPAKRYASATALADDLRRFLNGEPILARPLGAWGRGVKWARRHPTLAVLLCMTVAATVALVTVLSLAYVRVKDAVRDREYEAEVARKEREAAQKERDRAEALADENARARAKAERDAADRMREAELARRAAFAMQLAQVAIVCERDPVRAARLLDDPVRCPPDLRDFAWAYLRRLCQRDERAYPDHGATDPLRAVAFAPGGALVASAGDRGEVRLWDPHTGRTWAVLVGHTGAVKGVAFSPDGGAVATAGADGTVRLWELPPSLATAARRPDPGSPPDELATIAASVVLDRAHDGEATCVAFNPDGRAVVSGGRDGVIRVWELTGWRPASADIALAGGPGAAAVMFAQAGRSQTGQPVWEKSRVEERDGHPGGVLCLAFDHTGSVMASGGNDRRVKVWKGNAESLTRELPRHSDPITALAVSPDGRTVAAAGNSATPAVRLIDTQTWRERRLFGHTGYIFALAVSTDGQLVASAGFDKTVRLWDLADSGERGVLMGHTQQVNAVAFAPDRRTMVSVGMDGAAVVWHTTARPHEPEDILRFGRDPLSRIQSLTAVAIGGRGWVFFAIDEFGNARALETDRTSGPFTLTRLFPLSSPLPRPRYHAAVASPDGRTFVAVSDFALFVWRVAQTGGPTPGLPIERPVRLTTYRPAHALAIDPSDRWLATTDPEGVRLYDLYKVPLTGIHKSETSGGKLVLPLPGASEVTFHPAREWLVATAAEGFRVAAFDGKVLADVPAAHRRFENNREVAPRITAVAFDLAGTRLATGDESGQIKLWEVDADGRVKFVRDLTGHTGSVHALAFSPDGRTLASGGDDRAIILWDPVAGRERLSLPGHPDRVVDLAFYADGSALVTVSRDGSVKRWRADVRPGFDAAPLMLPISDR